MFEVWNSLHYIWSANALQTKVKLKLNIWYVRLTECFWGGGYVEAKRSTKIISRNPYKVANNFTSKKSYILNERGASCPSSILRHRLVRWADAVRRTDTVLPRGKRLLLAVASRTVATWKN